MSTLEKEFSKEVTKRDTLESIKILRDLAPEQFQSLLRFFLTMLHQSEEAREERLDSLLYLKMLPEQDFLKLIENMEHLNPID
ncbi:MAG: hypothetical protein CVV27_01215 [Candidatus Melainabacteria bacterium HGW-Melainabacteria-1]|nr:MAG: hypothetical protein CVV27_01215 [Candidatus Melainabacteria bacterium HGW-Melainabacteria-1]